ncbi:rod shape-determining protein MreD [uncultured Roseburia sp.]|uniref:Rod shape-determining protein MreD n=1 Tax=Brotonthovivens ammoniilytica TaxID=2981725 RepID=A0ABT2TGA3_9FIRM|nr:rod shape-determining protein MreD [Brotonthovivens ammoniilytica]MCU6761223.1 rod shape-determining protein MreD [Brotonthovivens ammoniilytica]SCI22405.1 rod shape-determining protein MreD [uncultured Roseburia sp.]
MRRKIVLAVTILICFLLQSTIFQKLSFASISPNLLIVVTAAFGFMRGRKEGLFVGFFCGLLMDLFFGSVLGIYALLYMFIGYINGIFKKIFYPEDIKLPIFLIAVSDLSFNIVIYFLMFLFRSRFEILYYFVHIMIPELVYTMIVAVVVYFLLLKVNQKLEEIEKRSAKKFG